MRCEIYESSKWFFIPWYFIHTFKGWSDLSNYYNRQGVTFQLTSLQSFNRYALSYMWYFVLKNKMYSNLIAFLFWVKRIVCLIPWDVGRLTTNVAIWTLVLVTLYDIDLKRRRKVIFLELRFIELQKLGLIISTVSRRYQNSCPMMTRRRMFSFLAVIVRH